MSVNNVNISGRLGRDPELKYTPSGKPVCSFSLAVEENFKGQDGAWQEKTHWIDCELWGKPAEWMAADARKGALVVVSGRLKQQTWEKDGQKRSKTFVSVAQAIVGAARSREDQSTGAGAEHEDQRPAKSAEDYSQDRVDVPYDDNLPF
jgi:single-strand DNA-binding protein